VKNSIKSSPQGSNYSAFKTAKVLPSLADIIKRISRSSLLLVPFTIKKKKKEGVLWQKKKFRFSKARPIPTFF
jgi:hypothetical protein